jgi:flagellar biosynthesis chaperone FliJ
LSKFRFGLQSILDERVREEEEAHVLFAHAQAEYRQACSALRETDAAWAACDRSAFVVLDGLEACRVARRRDVEAKRSAQDAASLAFEQARSMRMRLTILRERAYGMYLNEEEREEMRELDEANMTSALPVRL